MATEFIMPKLGLTMEEGTITEWFADDGDTVEAGAALLRIETDKTETDVEAAASGRLHRVGQVGDTFACGELIGWFLADGEQAPAAVGTGRSQRLQQRLRSRPRRLRPRPPPSPRRDASSRHRWRSGSLPNATSTCA